MRLLVVTARYPTEDRPAAGVFVRDRLDDPDLRVTIVAPHSYTGSRWIRFLRLCWTAWTARGRFDGVEGHFVLPTGPVALIAALLRRLPLVIVAHGGDVSDSSRQSPIHGWLARSVLRRASRVVANSTETADRIRELGAEAVVAPPGIDLSRFVPTPRPEGPRRVVYLGGDLPHKGVAIARELADTLVGPGLREVDPAEVPALMAQHEVVLVPSLKEPYGVVATEAIASGRWVVARAVGGLTEIVTDGVNGSLVHDGDFEGALAAVPDYDPDVVAATAARFGRERNWASMAKVWRTVLKGRGTRD
jgi:glycosyltransferase involved in cell wall biosynthesis